MSHYYVNFVNRPAEHSFIDTKEIPGVKRVEIIVNIDTILRSTIDVCLVKIGHTMVHINNPIETFTVTFDSNYPEDQTTHIQARLAEIKSGHANIRGDATMSN